MRLTVLGPMVAALLLAAPIAHAQDMPVMFDHFAGDMAMTDLLFNNTTGRIAAPATGRKLAASLAYTPTAALKASTVQGYVTRLKGKNPAAAQSVATNFGKHDYGQVYHGLTKDSGLTENDAASALSSFMILGWLIVNNVQDGNAVTVPMARGVRAQVSPRLLQNARMTAAGVPAQLGEEMKLLFVIVQGGWQSAIKEGKLPAYRQGIAAMFKNQYGLDMSLVNLLLRALLKNSAVALYRLGAV